MEDLYFGDDCPESASGNNVKTPAYQELLRPFQQINQ